MKSEDVGVKPDWRCLLRLHSWERYSWNSTSQVRRVRACRRCKMVQSYRYSHQCVRWAILDWGKLGKWREYQERQRYGKISPELKAIVSDIEYFNRHNGSLSPKK